MGPLNHPQGKVARALPKLTLWRFMQVHCPMALSSQRCRRYWKIIERALQREAQRAELGVGGDSPDAEQGLVGAVQISPGKVQGTIRQWARVRSAERVKSLWFPPRTKSAMGIDAEEVGRQT